MPDESLSPRSYEAAKTYRIPNTLDEPCYICARNPARSTNAGVAVCAKCRETHLTPREEMK